MRALVQETLTSSVHGTAPDVRDQLERLLARTGADELLVTGGAHDLDAQADSDRRLAALFTTRPA